jgi:hypothetical protein
MMYEKRPEGIFKPIRSVIDSMAKTLPVNRNFYAQPIGLPVGAGRQIFDVFGKNIRSFLMHSKLYHELMP